MAEDELWAEEGYVSKDLGESGAAVREEDLPFQTVYPPATLPFVLISLTLVFFIAALSFFSSSFTRSFRSAATNAPR